MKNISIIVAIALNNGIGKNNDLLWHISADLKRFRQITLDHTVIMGKNTYLSLPVRPLKNRRNIVITDNPSDHFEGCVTVFSVDEAIENCIENEESFVIGGASIYRQFLPYARRLYLTRVNRSYDADTFFPDIAAEEWEEISREIPEPDPQNDFTYEFIILKRKN
jgi:dihydrofolate reductase